MFRRLHVAINVLLFVASSVAQAQAPRPDFHARFLELASRRSIGDSARLAALFRLDWEYTNVESPETATFVGYPGQDERWTDNTPAAIARRRRELPDRLLVLGTIDRRRLGASDRLSFDIFERTTRESIEGNRFPHELLAVTQHEGPQYLAQVLTRMPTRSVADYERMLRRLAALPAALAQTRVLLDSGLAVGVTPPRVTLRDVPAQFEHLVPAAPMQSALLEPFTRFPPAIATTDRERLSAEAARIYTERVRPAYRELESYLATTYVPKARESIGWSSLPDGRA